MRCDGCGNEKAYRTFTRWDKYLKEKIETCDRCGDAPAVTVPDVYWDGKPEHGLADDPVTGKPRVFASRAEKAAYLKERGLVEAGDRTGGAFRTPGMAEGVDRRDPEIARRALAKVAQMGQDVRRQEYYRILKESGRR